MQRCAEFGLDFARSEGLKEVNVIPHVNVKSDW